MEKEKERDLSQYILLLCPAFPDLSACFRHCRALSVSLLSTESSAIAFYDYYYERTDWMLSIERTVTYNNDRRPVVAAWIA